MRTISGTMAIAGFLGLLAPAEAQIAFDGTYQLSSAAKLTESFVSRRGDMGFCPDRRPGPLTISNGMVRYTTESGRDLSGLVRPNGDFEINSVEADGTSPLRVGGMIYNNGTVRVRQIGNSCSYDFVWQKQS